MLMQYSVSPRWTLRIFGPNPSENVITRTPFQRASRKWPSSWMKTSTPRTNRNDQLNVSSCRDNRQLLILTLSGQLGRVHPGPRVDPPHLGQRRRRLGRMRVHRLLDDPWNLREAEPAL